MIGLVKKHFIIIIITIVLTFGVIIVTIKGNSSENVSNSNSFNDEITNKVPGMFAIMLETEAGSGQYELSTSGLWPDSNYKYNETLSNCENGGILTWNEETRSVNLKTQLSDRCYLYFDAVIPHDVIIYTNNNGSYNQLTPALLNCTGSNAEYNLMYNRIEISNIENTYTSCNLTYEIPSNKNYLNNYIISLSGTIQGDGQVVNEYGYRYEGKNPYNYIWFNNELWRIIGVFDESSHGQHGQNLVKIIRENPLGGFAWNKDNNNNWGESSLKALLNDSYYNSTNGTTSEYCYGYGGTYATKKDCDYTYIGINDLYRPMIKNVTWYLGGNSNSNVNTETIYGYERGTSVYSGNATTTTGYIGLMYPSDYGYSVLASSCARTTNIGSYGNTSCASQSWLYGKGQEWVITALSSSSTTVFTLHNGGGILYSNHYVAFNTTVDYGFIVRPVLYLDSNVYIINGDGSIDNPYIISI